RGLGLVALDGLAVGVEEDEVGLLELVVLEAGAQRALASLVVRGVRERQGLLGLPDGGGLSGRAGLGGVGCGHGVHSPRPRAGLRTKPGRCGARHAAGPAIRQPAAPSRRAARRSTTARTTSSGTGSASGNRSVPLPSW